MRATSSIRSISRSTSSRQVGTVTEEFRPVAFHDEAEPPQDARNLRRRNFHAEDALDLARRERNARLR